MQSRCVARSSAGLSAVRSCLLLLFIHMSAPVDARRVRGGRAQTRRVQQQQAPAYRERVEGPESFPLDFTAVEGNMDNFMVQIKNLAQSLYPCSAQKLDQDMKLHFLKNVSVTCNDGSPAGYYIKESKGSKRWLLFLEGGWYCFNRQTCDSRYETMRRLMSSTKWPQTRRGTGILSPQPEENPHWWNANMVFIPYCSSDVWSGATPKTDHSDYAFMGSLIIKEVVNELLTKGLDNAKVLLLAGSSAGGTGALLNVDHVAEQLESQGYTGVQVRGLADSGWFLDNKQYKLTDCLDTISCAPSEAIKRGIRYWGGLVPESCRQAHVGEEWKCFFGYKVYPTLKSPVFVVQWLFDEAQLTVDNIHLTGQPVHEGQWRYIQNLGQELRSTLHDVPAMFAPACLSHELITRTYWMDIQVKGTSLPRALHCWDRSLQDNLHINSSHGNHSHQKHKTPQMKGCPLHLIDSCPWPHCNPSCPTIRDQLTGQEMSVIQFLKHMGFDVQKMAQQQGMDPRKLLGMLNNGT
ncbi:inactive palmitoleoyl-protein carboxylesterase notum1b isoform X1 [Toxotes jaculatrix]|uniref:inactive palmitoleoyl-protein carboxylesterase notum1b isoform X1 n=2 Tax=Toxotes jaculatrix TaxID=941984 RepID=UPI001B3AD056|nr:inactive palmitoleoyl-protein carboxylesterase notum1b isoform X1 [Toxotes jaculatrix]